MTTINYGCEMTHCFILPHDERTGKSEFRADSGSASANSRGILPRIPAPNFSAE